METYRCSANSWGTSSVINTVEVQLWNPSTTVPVYLIELHLVAQGNALAWMKRVTVRGTPGATVTPDIDNAVALTAAPASGTVIDRGPSGGTLSSSPMDHISVITNAYVQIFFADPIVIPPGDGLCLANATIQTMTFTSTWVWRE